jgi:uncharacterized membrane protein
MQYLKRWKELRYDQIFKVLLILYSLFAIASITPTIFGLSNTILVVYFLFVPGYSLTTLIGEQNDIIQRLLYAVLLSTTLLTAFFALGQTSTIFRIPFAISIPIISILILLYSLHEG